MSGLKHKKSVLAVAVILVLLIVILATFDGNGMERTFRNLLNPVSSTSVSSSVNYSGNFSLYSYGYTDNFPTAYANTSISSSGHEGSSLNISIKPTIIKNGTYIAYYETPNGTEITAPGAYIFLNITVTGSLSTNLVPSQLKIAFAYNGTKTEYPVQTLNELLSASSGQLTFDNISPLYAYPYAQGYVKSYAVYSFKNLSSSSMFHFSYQLTNAAVMDFAENIGSWHNITVSANIYGLSKVISASTTYSFFWEST
jgi:hypothetical protein